MTASVAISNRSDYKIPGLIKIITRCLKTHCTTHESLNVFFVVVVAVVKKI